MKIRALPALLFCAVAVSSFADVPVIECPAEAPSVRRLQMQESWRIDPHDPDVPLLGVTRPDMIAAVDGRIYLLDAQLCQALIYSDDGEFEGTILREGEGPGEIRNPAGLFRCDDGRLAVRHGYPTRLAFVDPDGTPRGDWRLGCNAWAMNMLETPEGWLGWYGETRTGDRAGTIETVYHLALHDDEGERTRDFFTAEDKSDLTRSESSDEAAEHKPWATFTVTTNGEIVHAAARDEYRIEWKNLSGETLRVVTRPFAAHERTQDELDRLKYSSYSVSPAGVQFEKRNLCRTDAMIAALDPLPGGAVRVRTSRFAKDLLKDMVCRYEVHGPDGELRESVEIYDPTGEFDTDYDVIAFLDEERVVVLRNARPASRAAYDSGLPPEVREKMPPIPDERDDVSLTPIVCRLVPYEENR